MMAGTFEFELVSPEKLLISRQVEMVVVPGGDGTFGVLRGHVPLISNVRPGVIDVYDRRPVASERLFVAGGFAEVTGERCTVLVESVIAVGDLDRDQLDREVADLSEDLADAKAEADRKAIEGKLAVARAKRVAVG